jgi:hypothetical protein
MTSDGVEAAARVLVTFWRQPESLSLRARQLCERLTAMLDEGEALAGTARSMSPEYVAQAAAALRRTAARDPEAAGLVRRLAEGDSTGPRRSTLTQNATATGSGSLAFNVGRDFIPGGTSGTRARSAATETGPCPAPDVILMAAADPVDLTRMQLGREEREIREAIRGSAGRDRWKVELRNAVRLRDLCRALLETHPRVVHFSGHGSLSGGLFLEDDGGTAHHVPPEALNELFVAVEGEVECVVLNACYSEPQGRAISARVPFVIGTTSEIKESVAITFTVGFYQALGAGRTVRGAYSVGLGMARASGKTPPFVLLERG